MAIQIKQYNNNNQLIRTLKSIGKAEDFEIEPDNRMELVKTIDGATITDGGYYEEGDRYVLTANFDNSTYNYLKTIWRTRDRVDVVFDDGQTLENTVIVIRSVTYTETGTKLKSRLLAKYKKVRMEVWVDSEV